MASMHPHAPPPRRHDGLAGAAAAAATALSGLRSSGVQLLQAQAMLAPWIDRSKRASSALLIGLRHGPVELLQMTSQLADSPHASAKLLDDAAILLTYGVSYLQDHYDDARAQKTLDTMATERARKRQMWMAKAQQIQTTWRSQRFHTNRLGPLDLDTSAFKQPQAQELMAKKRTLHQQDSIDTLTSMPVEMDATQLQAQVLQYAAVLQKRVEARRKVDEELERKQLKEQRSQDEKRKRMVLQKKKRFENACRRWNYFATKLLRNARDDDNNNGQMDKNQPPSPLRHASTVARINKEATTRGATDSPLGHQGMMAKPHEPVVNLVAYRPFMRRFVAKAIARGVSRVLCAFDMGKHEEPPSGLEHGLARQDPPKSVHAAKKKNPVVKLGLLLCDLHFGIKYTGLYQRFFDRVAVERGVRVEWQVFNCLKSQFPTKAEQRVVDGFLVAGGPNIGFVADPNEPHASLRDGNDSYKPLYRKNSTGGARKNRHFGCWRDRLIVFLRDLHSQKSVLLGGLGLGHVILAEALGARIGMKDWEDGWSRLDPSVFSEDGEGRKVAANAPGTKLGIRFLHGEFVHSMGSVTTTATRASKTATNSIKSWSHPSANDQSSFVTCFRDKLTLSMDGSPECGSFVFETLSEFYERDKANRMRQELTRRLSQCQADENVDNDEDDPQMEAAQPLSLDAMLSLEEKKRRMGITDASKDVARLFFDHFHRASGRSGGGGFGGGLSSASAPCMAITGVLCSSDVDDLDQSIRHLVSHDAVGGIFLNVSSSVDGHLMVTNPYASSLLLDHDRRSKEPSGSAKRGQVSTATGGSGSVSLPPTTLVQVGKRQSADRTIGLTLQMLRDHDQFMNTHPSSNISTGCGSQRPSIRLPSIRNDASAKSLSEIMTPTSPANGSSRSSSVIRRTSTLSATGLADQLDVQTVSVLTLSQALKLIVQQTRTTSTTTTSTTTNSTNPSNNSNNTLAKTVMIRFMDEEGKPIQDGRLSLPKSELRVLWLRLVAAVRIADLPDDRIAVVARHSLVLEYLRRKRPTWMFVKDCRRSEMTHRKRLKKIAQYASIADTVLLDQDFVLSNSANENEALVKKAHEVGLHVYVAPRNESPVRKTRMTTPSTTKMLSSRKVAGSPTRKPTSPSSTSARRIGGGLSKEEISAQASSSDHDMLVVEMMLLQFSGVHGVITSRPGAATEARHKIATKCDATLQVEQLFRDWQAKDLGKAATPQTAKRTSQSLSPEADLLSNESGGGSDRGDEDPEDIIGGDTYYDSDDSVAENEIVTEMTRQWAEHSRSSTLTVVHSSTLSSGGGGSGEGVPVGPAASTVVMAAAPFVPLRPLQPKTGDQVLGAAALRRQTTTLTTRFTDEGRSRLRSIGSFRRPTVSMAGSKRDVGSPTMGTSTGTGMDLKQDGDDRNESELAIRGAEATIPSAAEAPGRMAAFKSMSARKILNMPS